MEDNIALAIIKGKEGQSILGHFTTNVQMEQLR